MLVRVPKAGTISGVKLLATTTVAVHADDYWTAGIVNKGDDGNGAAVIVDATAAANSTKAVGGAAVTANVARELTLGAAGDLVVEEGDVLLVTITKAAAAADLVNLAVVIEYATEVLDAAEQITCDELVAGGEITVPVDGKITLRRTGTALTPNLAFAYQIIGY